MLLCSSHKRHELHLKSLSIWQETLETHTHTGTYTNILTYTHNADTSHPCKHPTLKKTNLQESYHVAFALYVD